MYAYTSGNPISLTDPLGLYDIVASAGFHVPFSPGIAVGPAVSSSIANYSKNPRPDLSYDGLRVEVEAGAIADAGVAFGISDISDTGGSCEGPTFSFGLGRRSGLLFTLRLNQDKSKFFLNPSRYIDGFSVGLGIGIALPVSASTPVTEAYF